MQPALDQCLTSRLNALMMSLESRGKFGTGWISCRGYSLSSLLPVTGVMTWKKELRCTREI